MSLSKRASVMTFQRAVVEYGGGGSRKRTALRREQGTIQGNASRHLIQSVEFRPQRTASPEVSSALKPDISFANRELQGTWMGNPEHSINSKVPQGPREGRARLTAFFS
jgi:hypothetical protein